MRRGAVVLPLVLVVVAAGCEQQRIAQQTDALTVSSDIAGKRQQQMRQFDTNDEAFLLSASASVLQDLGFTIEEASAGAGLLMASKDRDAVEAQQVAGQLVLAALVTAAGGRADPVWEKQQKIRVSVATRRSGSGQGMVARVTFQRVIWNTKDQVSRTETIEDAEIYKEFFRKLSQATFLTAHNI
jgi:hypothetical protein